MTWTKGVLPVFCLPWLQIKKKKYSFIKTSFKNERTKEMADDVKVGLIGCGGFARNMHVPILKRNPKYKIYATADLNGELARKIAEDTGAQYWTEDVDKLLSDGEIDAVFIITRHDTHADLVIRAANAGKHIFCEKPMGLTVEECKAVAEAVKRNNVKYTVGYNRGMAPMVTKARDMVKGEKGKKMVYHRIQAPFPANVWTHHPKMGGGRMIGEGCHIFDLLCEIIQSEPVSVYAAGGIFLDPDKVTIPDSAIVTIAFEDGSVGATLISSAGCANFPKEATEIYVNGKAIHILDFKKMEYCGAEKEDMFTRELEKADKGHFVQLDGFADAVLNGSESPNGLVKAVRAAVISYKVNESIAKGCPIAIRREEYML